MPSRIAFLGSARIDTEDGATLLVRSLCWPSVPTAWHTLTQAWQSVSSGRGQPSAQAASATPSWIRACAPQIGALFGETAAEESSVAALVQRTPMQVAIAVVDPRDRRSEPAVGADAWRQALAVCLDHYDNHVRKPGREACTTLIAREDPAHGEVDDLAACRARLPDARWLAGVQLRRWSDSLEPLPLEIPHVVAAAIARQRLDPDATNPVFAAALTKLSHESAHLRAPTKSRRR